MTALSRRKTTFTWTWTMCEAAGEAVADGDAFVADGNAFQLAVVVDDARGVGGDRYVQ